MDITTYNLKLTEIDRKISVANTSKKAMWDKYNTCMNKRCQGLMGGNMNPSFCCRRPNDYNLIKQITALQKERATLIEEMLKEQQYLKDQEFLQQQQATAKAEAATAKALAQVEAAKYKSEQEKQKAAKELEIARTAQRLADKGDAQSSRILMGILEPKSYKKTIIIGGIVLVASGVGFGMYKLLK